MGAPRNRMGDGNSRGWDEFRVCPAPAPETSPWIYSIKLTPSFMEKLLRNPHQITLQLDTDKRGVFTGSDYEQEVNFAPCAKRTEPYECFEMDEASRSLHEVGQIQQKIIVPQMHADRSLRQQIHLITEKERREKESSKTGFSGASVSRKRGRPLGTQEPPPKATALPDATGAAPLAKSSIESVDRFDIADDDLRMRLIKLLARGPCSLRDVFGSLEGVPSEQLVAMLDQLARRKDGSFCLLVDRLTDADLSSEQLSTEDQNNISDRMREEEEERTLREAREAEENLPPPDPPGLAQKRPVSGMAQKAPAGLAQKKPASGVAQKTIARPARSPSPVRRKTAGKTLGRPMEPVPEPEPEPEKSTKSTKAKGERKTKKRSTKSSVPGASAIPSPPRTMKTKRTSRKKASSTSESTSTEGSASAPTNKSQRSQLRRLLKENIRQYEAKKQEFDQNYPLYQGYFDYLQENLNEVQDIGRHWETASDGPKKEELARKIRQMHQDRKQNVDDKARKCTNLVEKLNALRGELQTLSEDIKSKYQQLLDR